MSNMLTLEQAMNDREFHYEGPIYRAGKVVGAIACTREVGPRGGVTVHQYVVRRNGATQTWKTRHGMFRIPVKYGFRGYDSITHTDAHMWHSASECPLLEK